MWSNFKRGQTASFTASPRYASPQTLACAGARNPRSSLLITQPEVSGDPLGASRVTILGASTHVMAEEVRDLYLSRHENAKFWQDYSDFAFTGWRSLLCTSLGASA